MPRNFVPWRYTSDNGTVYVRRADDRYTAQTEVGGSSAISPVLSPYNEMPRNLKPRVAICTEPATGYTARVVIYTPTAFTALVTGTTTIDVVDASGDVHTCTVLEKVGEPPRGTIKRN